jgi:hypothetical protein
VLDARRASRTTPQPTVGARFSRKFFARISGRFPRVRPVRGRREVGDFSDSRVRNRPRARPSCGNKKIHKVILAEV